MRKLFSAGLTALALTFVTRAQAAGLITNSEGKLVGATGVDVGGKLYDVSFVLGSCADVYGSCDGSTVFDFANREAGTVAAQALLDQVLIGTFDEPTMVAVCVATATTCNIFIPHSAGYANAFPTGFYYLNYVGAFNGSEANGMTDRLDQSLTTVSSRAMPFARFTTSGSVPEPATWAMMLLGIGGIGMAMRRPKPFVLAA